jgi:hypothetical protein
MGRAQDRYFDGILKSGSTMLARWQGASAEMWELTRSHRTLRIVLLRKGISGNLLLSCLEPVRLRGPARWEPADITIARTHLPDGLEDGFRVADDKADMEILCGALEIKENVNL